MIVYFFIFLHILYYCLCYILYILNVLYILSVSFIYIIFLSQSYF